MSLWALERAWWRSSSFALHVGASPTHHLPINSSTSNNSPSTVASWVAATVTLTSADIYRTSTTVRQDADHKLNVFKLSHNITSAHPFSPVEADMDPPHKPTLSQVPGATRSPT